ncbi:MAG: PxKF domain-containing protein [Blastocatellia bacterium]
MQSGHQPDGNTPRGTTDLNVERRGHAAVALGHGKVLVLGGENNRGVVKESELFDVASRSFSLVASLIVPRTDAVAIRLMDGRVLVLGGRGEKGKLRSTEVYDAASNSFSRGPRMSFARAGHTANQLANGKLLIVGGDVEGSAEILDPSTESIVPMVARLHTRRAFHSAVVLKGGKVLIAGGRDANATPVASAEIFDPEKLTFTATRSSMLSPRIRPTLRVLPDGKVQVIGGDDKRSMEMFNAAGQYFTALAHLVRDSDSQAKVSEVLRAETRAALIHRVERESVEIKRGRSSLLEDEFKATSPLSNLLDRADHTLTEIPESGTALISGGINSSSEILTSATTLDSSTATVTTDKTDYSPGETVVITGTNWQPDETVQLTLHRDNDAPDTVLSALADQDGNISNSVYVVQESDLDVTFLLTAIGQSSGFTALTTFTDQSNLITQIGFNVVNQPASFTVGVPNVASSPLRVQSRNGAGNGESVTGTGNSVTVQVTSNSATGRFDTSSGGSFAATSLTLQITAGNQNTPDFFYRDTTAGSVTLIATVSAANGVNNMPINSTALINKTVNKANTTTNVISSIAPLQCGQVATFTATVVHTTAGGTGTPTGTVTFKDGVNTLGTSNLVAGPPFAATFTISVLSLGNHTITAVYAGDSNFNTSTSSGLAQAVVDNQVPAITLIGPNSFNVQCHTTFTDPGATATDTCADDLTSAIVVTGIVDANAVGSYTRTYSVSDPSGNPAVAVTRTVNVVDTTAPTISVTGANPLTVECHTTFTDPGATATDSCAGNLTGSIEVSGDTVNASVPGTYHIHYNVSDPSINPATTATRTVIVVDTTLPTLAVCAPSESVPANSSCLAAVPDFTARVTASDICGSVTLAQSPAAGTMVGLGSHTITITATDNSNNSNTCSATFTVDDDSPPVITTCAPAETTYANTSCQAAVPDFTRRVVATDCNGPVTKTQVPAPGTVVGLGSHTVTITVEDADYNTASCSTTFEVSDNAPPTISACAPNQMIALTSGNQTAPVPDFTGGVSVSDCNGALTKTQTPIAGTQVGVGTTTVAIRATDAAGNYTQCTAQLSVYYNFAGFFQPVDNLPIVNTVKAGSAIPIKFSLSGYQGLNIFSTAYPLSAVIACNFTDPGAAVEETVNAGGSSLNYDLATDQYIYVWKTEKSWANSCRQLVVVLKDGNLHRANFKFSK